METCTICLTISSALHHHHTIPRACGGEDSLQIPLCGTCHTQLHSNALNVISRITKGKAKLKTFWSNPEDADRAEPYLQILVKALLQERQNPNREFIINANVRKEIWEELKLIQADLNLSSIEKTIEYCIEFTARGKGLKNDYTKDIGLWFKKK